MAAARVGRLRVAPAPPLAAFGRDARLLHRRRRGRRQGAADRRHLPQHALPPAQPEAPRVGVDGAAPPSGVRTAACTHAHLTGWGGARRVSMLAVGREHIELIGTPATERCAVASLAGDRACLSSPTPSAT
eukprot:2357663-Prymnesium_polylepis.2